MKRRAANGSDRKEDSAARNVEEIAALERHAERQISLGERVSLALTTAIGTGTCLVIHAIGFASWIGWNTNAARAWRFDPYPFGLLTMWVSMEGVLLAIFVLITQNRMSRQSDRRDQLDLQVDLLAEQEMTMVLRILSKIAERIGVRPDSEEQAQTEHLMQRTNLYELMEELRRRFR